MLKLARLLLLLTILYNVVGGIIALWSGIAAGSIALVAFGADRSSAWVPTPRWAGGGWTP